MNCVHFWASTRESSVPGFPVARCHCVHFGTGARWPTYYYHHHRLSLNSETICLQDNNLTIYHTTVKNALSSTALLMRLLVISYHLPACGATALNIGGLIPVGRGLIQVRSQNLTLNDHYLFTHTLFHPFQLRIPSLGRTTLSCNLLWA